MRYVMGYKHKSFSLSDDSTSRFIYLTGQTSRKRTNKLLPEKIILYIFKCFGLEELHSSSILRTGL